jgi:tetratricopeptide (TPR) repeat protein
MDLTMPERISDYAYFVNSGAVERRYLHECNGEVICAVPIDGLGVYDLFYSRTEPELGLSVLRDGFERANRKTFIAEDLGYILRDEGRLEEAIQAFRVAASAGPSSNFIYLELANLYDMLDQPDLATEFRAKCPDQNHSPGKKPWWKLW